MAQSSRRYYVVGDYMVGRQIGAGSFSTVRHARHRIHGTEVAIKEIDTARLNPRLQESLKSEIFILKRINHPNIIRLHDMIEEPGKIYIILEYCKGGDLSMHIQRYQGRIPEAAAKYFMQQLAEGLKVLRENNLIHRDLKPQNLLLSSKGDNSVLKIADFGFARSLQPRVLAETLCGSPLYMAPEIMQLQKYDAKADLWSVGAILFQLVTGKPPFNGSNQIQLLQNIMKSTELQFPPEAGDLSPDCIDLCKKLLRRNPVERLTFEEFFNHPYVCDGPSDETFRSRQSERLSDRFHPSTSSEQSPQDDLPFTLDDDTTVPDTNPLISGKTMYGFSVSPRNDPISNLGGKASPSHPRIGSPRSAEITGSSPGSHGRALRDDIGCNPKVLDSLESIDQDYVIVSGTHLGSSTSLRSSKESHCPHDSRVMVSASEGPPIAGGATAGASCSGNPDDRMSSQGSMDTAGVSEQPYADSVARISSLQRYASAISELVKSKLEAGKPLEGFSVQLVILAISKQALNIFYTRAASAFEGSPEPHDICSKIEREFLREVGLTEELAKAIDPGNMEMPDAMELIYQSALAFGKHGAVDEYMGDMRNAAVFYSKAVVLLQFLLIEASSLILNPPLSLTSSDRCRIQHYVDALTNRQSISLSRRMEILNPEEARPSC